MTDSEKLQKRILALSSQIQMLRLKAQDLALDIKDKNTEGNVKQDCLMFLCEETAKMLYDASMHLISYNNR